MTNSEKLREIQEKCAGCTEGEWKASDCGGGYVTSGDDSLIADVMAMNGEGKFNQHLLAAAPALLRIATDQQAQHAAKDAELGRLREAFNALLERVNEGRTSNWRKIPKPNCECRCCQAVAAVLAALATTGGGG